MEPTLYLAYEGPLPAALPKQVEVNIMIHERFVLPIEERTVLRDDRKPRED